jgi:hypothetical protein
LNIQILINYSNSQIWISTIFAELGNFEFGEQKCLSLAKVKEDA